MKKERATGLEKKLNTRYKAGISWRLFGSLTVFVALILMVIWLFQAVLLNRFYEDSKLREFTETDEEIFTNVGNIEALNLTVYSRSVDTDTCIKLFKIADGHAKEIVDSDVNMGCFIHHIPKDSLSQLYENAVKNGGTFTQKISNPSHSERGISSVYASVKEGEDGNLYFLIQDSELLPLSSTVMTLERQFGWIMCILVMGALVMALLLSRLICIPMQRMSRSAKQLAKGDYNTKFYGGGYWESEELAEALNYAASELQKTDALQKELVANISHDLRTPLTMIKGYSEVMRDIPDENTPENIQIIIDETERLTRLVNDMLDLSKIRSGTIKPEKDVFDITETVRAVLVRYEKFTEQMNYRIAFEADENICVRADRTMILQVVYNLVNNAMNYTGEDKSVVIKQTLSQGKVRISVTDSGEGIDEEDIPLIWDRYYKVDKIHKRAVVGTGLGLSIVKGILEAHNANFGVESKKGEGSTFYFELDAIFDAEFEKNK